MKLEKFNIFLLFLVLCIALIPTAKADFLQIKDYDVDTKTYEVRDWLGVLPFGNDFDVKQISNTDKCDKYCTAELELTFYNDYTIKESLEGFNLEFISKQNDGVLLNYQLLLWDNIEQDKYEYIEVKGSNGTTNKGYIKTGTEIVKGWKEFNPKGFSFKKDTTYKIKIDAVKLTPRSTDWIITMDSARLEKMSWWDPTGCSTDRKDYALYETGDINADGDVNPANNSQMLGGGWTSHTDGANWR